MGRGGLPAHAAAASSKNKPARIGYQRFYNPVYQAAYSGIIKAGVLGDIYHSRIVWHRNGTWRRRRDPPSPDYDPSKWGYPTFDHLINWRLYNKYSRGLLAELASHQLNVTNWFFDSSPTAVIGTAVSIASPKADASCPTTCSPRGSIPAAAPCSSRRLSRTLSIAIPKRSSAQRVR